MKKETFKFLEIFISNWMFKKIKFQWNIVHLILNKISVNNKERNRDKISEIMCDDSHAN